MMKAVGKVQLFFQCVAEYMIAVAKGVPLTEIVEHEQEIDNVTKWMMGVMRKEKGGHVIYHWVA